MASESIDIKQMPEIIDIVNKALNDNRIVEIKNEGYNTTNIVVVCVDRKVLTKSKNKKISYHKNEEEKL